MVFCLRRVLVLLAISLSAASALAQFNNTWVTFVADPNRIKNPDGSVATQVTTDPDEKDYDWADVDMDGWIDLVVVRKQPAATLGKRVNQLLMNDHGVLVDRTSQYAVDSDVPGDFGFATATNDRDVKFVDVDNDGWLDMVTATTLSDGDPKYLSHPRVYHNKGSIGGVWQGFRYEDARFPQLYTVGGLPVAPRFCAVAVGDVNGDGFADLYFADYDNTETGYGESAANDLNDRLLINNGAGYFVDSLETRMSTAMLKSAFGMAAKVMDMNGDGALDVVKASALGTPQEVSIAYNNPANLGFFNVFQAPAADGSTYHVDAGDLNRDGRPDLIVSDDGLDFYKINLGNDGLGRVIWSADHTYSFLTGSSDGGFAGNNLIVDLDGDGWPDTIHADFDVDVTGCTRHAHIYHNLGGAIGSEVVLREEAQMSGATGWKGAVGLQISDTTGTYDIAVFDIDNDGDNDLILGRCTGTFVWINQTAQPTVVTSYCFGNGSGTACPCGHVSAAGNGCPNGAVSSGARLAGSGYARVSNDSFVLTSTSLPAFGPGLFFQGTAAITAGSVFGNGLICVTGATPRLEIRFADASGTATSTVAIHTLGADSPSDLRYYQMWYRDDPTYCPNAGFNLTNAVSLTWGP